VLPPDIKGNPEAVFEVTQLPSGEVINVRLKKSSGNAALRQRSNAPSSSPARCQSPNKAIAVFDRLLNIPYRPRED
jgi:colicin import membrane protein